MNTKTIGSWTKPEIFLVFSLSLFVFSFINFLCGDSLTEVPDLVREGELDLILLKPVDPQFLVSTKETHPANIYRIVFAFFVLRYAIMTLEKQATLGNLILGFLFILSAMVIFYSMLLLIASASFYVLENSLGEVFENFLSVSKYPIDIFPRAIRILLTVIPAFFLVTVPARVIIGRTLPFFWLSFPIAVFLFYFSRRCFLTALKSYTGAGG